MQGMTRRSLLGSLLSVPAIGSMLALGGCTPDQVVQAIQVLCGVTADALAIAALLQQNPGATVQQIAAMFCAAFQQQKARLRAAPVTVLVNGQQCLGGYVVVNGINIPYCGTPRVRRSWRR